ncbi:MAG: SGNH/GDSL hydrolase family protein [Clostridia bacterium]|nr:SGNH/GDSL hydrolase family protein [Clostridia bacterium]
MDIRTIRTPVWDTGMMYEESILFLRDGEGRAEAALLYDPVEVIRVECLAKGEVYEENIDYTVENGRIVLTENSRIFSFAKDELFPADPAPGESFPMPGGNSLFHEGAFFIERQTAVTYRCEEGQWNGVRPALAEKELARSLSLLRSGKPMRMVLFGDSISAAANNTRDLNLPPFQPGFGEMLCDWLKDAYSSDVFYVNTAVGGKETRWAVETADERVASYDPDLVILAFGMNDGAKTMEEFVQNTRRIISIVREKKPECEFLLVATSLPNPILTDPKARFWSHQERHMEALSAIAADTAGVAVADIGSVHRYMQERKRFIDMTSNNVNHPNDFFYRVHAQFLAGMLIG